MLFSSIIFLFAFLPISLIAYYASPKKIRNGVLLFLSLIFYAWGGLGYALILIGSILANYILVTQIERSTRRKRAWLIVGLTLNILIIVFFKYLDFIIENINAVGLLFSGNFEELPLKHILLPLGISFFTFQQMSLLWDVYRDPQIKKASLVNTALYISLFPQLIAGPIVRYNDIIAQIKDRSEHIALFRSGINRFVLGLFKKIIIANACGAMADSIMNTDVDLLSSPVAWLGIVAYSFQIYFDFSGYSDMAIGIGRMFGFKILENFNFPYIARSLKEFWQRWHISLSTWFRDYVYIPMGGSRGGTYKTYYNLLIVFILTGFWHGATWSFVVWGLFHGAFLIVEKLGFDRVLKRMPKAVSWSYTLLIVMIAWVFFRIENLGDATKYIGKMFGGGSNADIHLLSYMNSERIVILILAVLSSSPFFAWLKTKLSKYETSRPTLYVLGADMLTISMFVVAVAYITSDSYNPFIYFRF